MKKYDCIDALNEVSSYCQGAIKKIKKEFKEYRLFGFYDEGDDMENSQYQDVINFIEELKEELKRGKA
jgi:hypothetical protein